MKKSTVLIQKVGDCMLKNFAGKWISCRIYEACLRKFHCSTTYFETFVNMEFKNGYVKLLNWYEKPNTIAWYSKQGRH